MDANTALGATDTSLQGNMNSARARYQTDLDAEQKEIDPLVKKAQATSAEPLPAIPEPKKAAPAPDAQQFNKDAQGWVSALAAFSALIGARGRARGTGALKAFAAGVNGLQKGNQQAFDDAYKTWKGDTDAMLADNKQEMDKYEAVLKNRELTEQEAHEQIKLIGYEHQNKLMMDAKDFDQQAAIYESAVKARVGAETYVDKIQARYEAQRAEQDHQDKILDDTINTFEHLQPNDVVPGYGITKQAILDKVKTLHDTGGNYSVAGISMRTMNNPIKQLVDVVKSRMYPNDNTAEQRAHFVGEQQEERAMAGRSAPAKIAVKEMDNLAQPMIDAVKKLDPKHFPDLNSLRNAYQQRIGGADVVKAALAVQEFKTAFTNLMIRNGVPTDQARARGDELINMNMSLDQIEGLRDQAKISGAAVIDALAEAKGEKVTPSASPSSSGAAPDFSYLWNGGE